MKIAVFHNLPSGGAKRALYGLLKYLTRSGCSIHVYVPSTADESFLPLKEIANKVIIIPLNQTMKGLVKSTFQYILPLRISLADLERTQKAIAECINHGDYDVVFIEQDQFTMSPFVLKYLKKPHVYYCPQPQRNEEILRKLSAQLDRSFVKRLWREYTRPRLINIDKKNASYAKYIITNSFFSREAILRAYGLNAFVSYLGVDTELFKSMNLKRERFVISVGSLTPAKGYDFIIRALSLIKEDLRPHLVIVGNVVYKPYENYLKELALRLRVNLEVKVLIDDEELIRLYNKAQLCVYAPYLEPFGLVAIEAMACGTPVIAVKEGGARESVLDKETGLLVERDEQQFANAVSQLLEDKETYNRMSKRCVEVVMSFWTLEHAVQRLLLHMEKVQSKNFG